MRNRIVSSCWKVIWSSCALGLLAACGSAPTVTTKPEAVLITDPVVEKIDPALTKDCEPRYRYPVTSMKVKDLKDRAEAAEDALAICRNQLALIRAAQDKPPEPRPAP